jgi:surface antigen
VKVISTTSLASPNEHINSPANFWVAKLYHHGQLKLRKRTMRRRVLTGSLIAANLIVVGVVLTFVLQGSSTSALASTGLSNNNLPAVNPVDQVSSANIALTVAEVSSLPEATAISNQAQSAAAQSAVSANSNDVISKPQVMGPVLMSNDDIKNYVSVAGDTITSLATKFGVTSNSIMWSNNLSSNILNPGTSLAIPPVNGIVYTVAAGDTPQTLATRYDSNSDEIIAYNDAELNGLTPGERIIIPNGVEPSQTTTTAADIANASTASGSSFAWGGDTPIYGSSDGYDYGYCTWYVAKEIPVPSNWGNADSWAYYAALSGWNVSKTPTVGAIAQIGARGGALSEGHVAIVDAVSADGTQVQFRDMNGIAGWGNVGYSGWVPSSTFDNYITH